MTYVFDILIIGGGHAGVEAALIARKMGRQVGLVSLDHSKTGRTVSYTHLTLPTM